MPARSPLPGAWEVPAVFRQRLRESVGRQRVITAEGHLLLVLHAPPVGRQAERAARFFWRAPDGAWRSNVGAGIGALQNHIAEFDAILEKLEETNDRAEWSSDFFPILRQIAPLHRTAENLYDALQQARELAPDDSDLILCRDRAYAVSRHAQLVQTDATIGLDCAVARREEEQADSGQQMAESAHRFNLLAAVFFPLVTISAIFGMNFRHGFENVDREPMVFWLIVVGGLILGLLIKSMLSPPARRKRDSECKQPD